MPTPVPSTTEELLALTDDETTEMQKEIAKKIAKLMLVKIGTAVAIRVIAHIIIQKINEHNAKENEEDLTDLTL